MPKTKKTEGSSSSSDSDSGPDDKVPTAAKKSKGESAKDVKTNTTNNKAGPWTLEKLRKISITEFRGRKYVDIREFYEKDGKTLPGKKGISLSLEQWKKLLEVADQVTAAIKDQ